MTMRVVTSKELSTYKVLPFDLFAEDIGKILEAGEVLSPGKLIMLKNYPKLFTEEYNSESMASQGQEGSEIISDDSMVTNPILNFSYEKLDISLFETVINKDAYIKTETQAKIKYFYKLILNLLQQGYYKEGLLKLNSLSAILKTEILKRFTKSGKGSRVRFLGEYEICHPLNVAIISGLIAKKLEYSPMSIDQVMMAALLHDVGKLKINLKDSQALFTVNEDEVKNHPEVGYKMIKEVFELPEEIALVALEHHENNDGSGYPQGLSSDYITEYSQIINVANFYDNLACNRTHIMIMNNKEALRTMLEFGTKRFSAKMLYSFIHMFNYDDSKSFSDMAV